MVSGRFTRTNDSLRTNSVLDKLMINVVNRGGLTALAAALNLILVRHDWALSHQRVTRIENRVVRSSSKHSLVRYRAVPQQQVYVPE